MPLIIRYPKAIKAGRVSNAITMNVDFAPTLLDFAGADIPADIQGESLRPILENGGRHRLTGEKPPIITIMNIRQSTR